MGRAVWIGVKFLVGAMIGAVIGATVTAYGAGAADPAGAGEGLMDGVRTRLNAAKTAGDAAAMQMEAALTQQFRSKVQDPDALNPPTALHPQI
ncbi:MAG: hypothetical protein LC793_13680 [Thermomicrobia bacterium]|nr:hypothetical protein [Thermomicrobia bacterium]MCA1722816.1 hypothetical protein [Thermomicrobia bacterium]